MPVEKSSKELVYPLCETNKQISNFDYDYNGINNKTNQKIINIPIKTNSLTNESILHENNSNKENFQRSIFESSQNFDMNKNKFYNFINKNNQSTAIKNISISYNTEKNKIKKNKQQKRSFIVPIQISPLKINSNTNIEYRKKIGLINTFPEHKFYSDKLKYQHSINFLPQNNKTINSPLFSRLFFFNFLFSFI